MLSFDPQQPITPAQYDDLRAWTHKMSDYAHFIGLAQPMRPGVRPFMTLLEYQHFPPTTALNDVFHCQTVIWMETVWVVVSIPQSFFFLAREIAPDFGLTLDEGLPTMLSLGDKKAVSFPVIPNGTNIWHLKNQRDHPMYKLSAAELEERLGREEEFVRGLWEGNHDTTNFMKSIYGRP